MVKLFPLFKKCLNAEYVNVPSTDGDYSISVKGKTLYLYLQCTTSKQDWRNNFDFPAVAYRDMPKTWRAHRGFVRVWKSIEPCVKDYIMDPKIKRIIIVGYSHGASLACLAHEYVWFNRPDIRDDCYSYAFEPARVFWGFHIPKDLKERWKNLYVIRNGSDIVTHVPFAFMGFKHVGNLIKIGDSVPLITHNYFFKCVDRHAPENVANSLKIFDQKNKKNI